MNLRTAALLVLSALAACAAVLATDSCGGLSPAVGTGGAYSICNEYAKSYRVYQACEARMNAVWCDPHDGIIADMPDAAACVPFAPSDAGPTQLGAPWVSWFDAGPPDAGPRDAGPLDSSPLDGKADR